jgi:hypothetical protein
MERDGTILHSRCDYILGTDRRIFKYISIKDPFYNSNQPFHGDRWHKIGTKN